MKITIYGLPGTGTSTVAKILAQDLKLEFKYTGQMFRDMASDMGLTLNELEALAQADSKYDLELDEKVTRYGKEHDNFIFDSRLAWYFIPDSIKIKLRCDHDESIRRIMEREKKSREQVEVETADRLAKITDRYSRYYGIDDYDNDANFDYIIDTTTIPAAEVAQRIKDYLSSTSSV